MSLQHTLEALYGLERRRDKLNLDGTLSLLAALGDPHLRFRSVHVAGTNGKGSVCALVERVLREAGHRTGLFTSPHLVDFRERIRVNGRWADEAWLERRLEHIQGLPEGRDRTFFEVCTALAFEYFAEQGVEIAVVEVGLGGRLDCTNVLTPLVSVITTIGFDHTEILGDTLEKIAAEKAGIIKPGVPVVSSVQDKHGANVIARVAAERGAPLVCMRRPCEVDRPFQCRVDARPFAEWFPIPRSLPGVHQACNVGAALDALRILRYQGVGMTDHQVVAGLNATRWPGRLEACPNEPRLWWDGAHNPDGFMTLGPSWLIAHRTGFPRAIVLALSRDKDARRMIGTLYTDFGPPPLVVTCTRSERGLDPVALARIAAEICPSVEVAPDVPSACRRALDVARKVEPQGNVLLTGSLFAVGEAMERFGGAPGEML